MSTQIKIRFIKRVHRQGLVQWVVRFVRGMEISIRISHPKIQTLQHTDL